MPNDTTRNGQVQKLLVTTDAKVILQSPNVEMAPPVSTEAMRQKLHELQMQNDELRRTQLELDSARARYFDLYDLAPVGYCTLNAAGLIVEANLTAAVLLGASRRDLIGKPISRYICESDQDVFYLQRKRLLEDGLPVSFDLCMHKANLEPFWALVAGSVETLADQSIQLRLVLNDISARRATEANVQEYQAKLDQVLQEKNASLERATALAEGASRDAELASQVAEKATQVAEKASHAAEKASQVAEKASQAKSAFLSSMSHELRTPLNAILGFAQMLEIGLPPPTPLQKRNVDQILKAGWYLLELINEVLDLSMIESGKVMLSREPVGLADLLLECRAMIEPQAQKRGISLHFPRLERGSFVSADRTRFKQVLLNLLLNAIKYNRPNGSVVIECTLSSADTLRIGVRDTGAGMAPEQMAHLFQPFNRLGKETGVEEGTGIGLVVTKRLVELMGGSIGVESNVDVGTLFWIELRVTSAPQFATHQSELPQELACNSATDRQSDTDRNSAVPLRTLLYVEDNPANLELVEQLVAMRNDIRLISATDGSVGIEFARNLQPDVILMDINLPGISGIQALQILRIDQNTKHIPVIALSANAMASDIEQGLRLGFFHYLTKPIRVRDFMQTLDAALAFAQQTNKEAP